MNELPRLVRTCGLVFFVASLSGGLVTLAQLTVVHALALGVLGIGLGVLATRGLRDGLDVFDPLVTGTITFCVLFGARPLYMLLTNEKSYYYGADISRTLSTAVLLGLLGLASFIAGYGSVRRRTNRTVPGFGSISTLLARSMLVLLVALGLALYAAFLLNRFGSISYGIEVIRAGRSLQLAATLSGVSEYVTAAPILSTVGATFMIVTRRGRLAPFDWALVLLAVCVPVLLFGFLGNRRFVIPAVLIPTIAWYLSTGSRPKWRTVFVGGTIGFLLLAALPYARSSGARDQAGGFVPLMQKLVASPTDLVFDRFLGSHDTEMVAALAVQIEMVQDPFWGRATVGDLLIAPIPSALFPGKPVTARNQVLIEIYGSPCQAVGGRCPDFSAVGTFHQDIPYVGVLVGCLLLGAFSATVWRRATQPNASRSGIATGAVWAVMLPVLLRAGFMPAFAWFLYFALPLVLVIYLASLLERPANVPVGSPPRVHLARS